MKVPTGKFWLIERRIYKFPKRINGFLSKHRVM